MLYERVADFRGTPSHDPWAREGVDPVAFPLPTTYLAKSTVSERAVLGTRRRELTTDGLILRVILRSGPFLTSKAPYASITEAPSKYPLVERGVRGNYPEETFKTRPL